jgi:hypothetical protein
VGNVVGESDGEGCQPLGGVGCGVSSMRRGGTTGNGVAGGTVAARRNDSCDDGVCDLTGGSSGSIDASGDTRAEP